MQQPALLKITLKTIIFVLHQTTNTPILRTTTQIFKASIAQIFEAPIAYHFNPHQLSYQIPATKLHALASTTLVTVPNHHVGLPIFATNVIDLDAQATIASPTPVQHFDLKPANPLPTKVLTPINITNFSNALHHHPDQELVTYLIDGLTNGFSIGYNNVTHSPTRPKNLLSATEHPTKVTEALCKELNRGHTSGPFSVAPWPDLHCSPLGSREKKYGSRRLIMDLSQPRGSSINDGIAKEDFNVQYTHFDSAT